MHAALPAYSGCSAAACAPLSPTGEAEEEEEEEEKPAKKEKEKKKGKKAYADIDVAALLAADEEAAEAGEAAPAPTGGRVLR